MQYWLLKSEPKSYSIDQFAKDKTTTWDGVRNYQARNLMRDQMKSGDLFLFYHSSSGVIGVAGIGKIVDSNLPDATAINKKDLHFDPKATKSNNPWVAPKIKFVSKFKRIVTMEEIKNDKRFTNLPLLKKGNRLSVQPVASNHFELIKSLVGK